MVDVRRSATLRGFPVSVADVGDQVHLCHPLLSFEGDPALYLAHRLDWRDDPKALAVADPNEASALGTLLPPACVQPIASGEGLVAVGAELVEAAAIAGVELPDPEISFARVDGSECWIGVATPALYTALRTRLAAEARAAFDEALEDAVHLGSCLSERGNAALLLMRTCDTLRRDDLAIRQLAGELQNREFDLYRRLLTLFALELDTEEEILDERVRRHIAAVAWKPSIYDLIQSDASALLWPHKNLVRVLIRFAPELDTQEKILDEQVRQHVAAAAWKHDMSDLVRSGASAPLWSRNNLVPEHSTIRTRLLPMRSGEDFASALEIQGWDAWQGLLDKTGQRMGSIRPDHG